MKRIIVILFCCFVIMLLSCSQQPLYKETQVLMGTFVEVISSDAAAAKIVFAEIKRIEGLLSNYQLESDIGRLNQLGKAQVSQDSLYVIKKAKEFWQMTDGAFDITVAPLLELWGFKDKHYRMPEKNEIDSLLKLIGSDKIIIDEENKSIEFAVKNIAVDLGAIAKGYAVDCAVKRLKEAGIKSALINAGGDIYCLGSNSGKPWKIAVRDSKSLGFAKILTLKDKAVATSGNYEQYFILDNKRYAHIFNPKSGYPAESGVVSVTVIAPDCLTADALATSIFVLGKDKGQELVKRLKGEIASIITE
jgi:thiamine biosynthesis lipoprotein